MPLYEYQCEACGRRFEVIQKFSDPVLEVCRLCERGPVQRLLSSPAIQFKGSGWYITDYAQKGQKGKSDTASSGTTAGEGGKGDSAKSESTETAPGKAETRSDSASAATPAKPAD